MLLADLESVLVQVGEDPELALILAPQSKALLPKDTPQSFIFDESVDGLGKGPELRSS